jgi:hypothetical protein
MRLLRGRSPEEEREAAWPKVVLLVALLVSVPVWTWFYDWRLGLFVSAAFVALGLGMWRVSRER